MTATGIHNPARGIDQIGLRTSGTVRYNFAAAELYEQAIAPGEARLTAHGALVAYTGNHTGRSPKDKFIVRDQNTAPHVWWDNNKPMAPEAFERLHADFLAHAAGPRAVRPGPVRRRRCGKRLQTRVVTEYAWHSPLHPQSARSAPRARSFRVSSADDHHRPAVLPGRPGAAWLRLGDGDCHRSDAHDRADRRHRLCRRDEEGGVHRAQLPAARTRRPADALLGQ